MKVLKSISLALVLFLAGCCFHVKAVLSIGFGMSELEDWFMKQFILKPAPDPVPADPVLADLVLADPVLADPAPVYRPPVKPETVAPPLPPSAEKAGISSYITSKNVMLVGGACVVIIGGYYIYTRSQKKKQEEKEGEQIMV